MREAFALHDRKAAKTIPTSELGNALRSVGKRLTAEHVKTLSERADRELAGKLTYDDFVRFVELASAMEKRDRDVENAFKVLSEGHNGGAVTVATLRHALTSLGDKLTHKQVDAFLAEAGVAPNSNALVDLEKFMKVINATGLH